ncbi:MAG TPA: VOC family protein [Frankiaceae bacterium]|jgi:hypothetical protein|nr:VOC family protein [Frankiaceae bacterium]
MTVPPRLSLVTLGVADVEVAAAFYERLGWTRSSASVPGLVAFFATATGAVVGLYGYEDHAADAGRPPPRHPGGFNGTSLAMNMPSPHAVDEVLRAAQAAGATVTKTAAPADWGGYSGYFADPDGNAWEVAYNPHWPVDDTGRVNLP